uniref:Uncharacterized protein n=1 Tax=Rhizophora mucronata TaxID=61149 RepID=A0A2P2JH81_RHIMU
MINSLTSNSNSAAPSTVPPPRFLRHRRKRPFVFEPSAAPKGKRIDQE